MKYRSESRSVSPFLSSFFSSSYSRSPMPPSKRQRNSVKPSTNEPWNHWHVVLLNLQFFQFGLDTVNILFQNLCV